MQHLKAFLDQKVKQYNCIDFIELDPISVPHTFTKKEDIEIAGFFAATLAWGNRKAIIKSLNQLMAWMDHAPYDFVTNANANDLKPLVQFVYRTFNGSDCVFFVKSLKNIYQNYGGLEKIFTSLYKEHAEIKECISGFKKLFFTLDHEVRTEKHVADPVKGSAAKRINMFLRWMVRKDTAGVDFGLWKDIPMQELMIPLDVHSGGIARKLELLDRKQSDWKAVELLTKTLREFDPHDPVKYDFALFGLGVNGDLEHAK